jgi:aconitate hydratase
VLPLTLKNPADFDKVSEDDRVSVTGLTALAPGSEVTLVLKRADGNVEMLECRHTLTDQQIEWFRAGSALAWIGS